MKAVAVTRELRKEEHSVQLVVVGGGLSGVCCAITAARHGIRVILVQDRPVLGGNASSEVRLWILGATSHMGNNNRWAREGGVIDELLVENMWRNREGNPVIFDSLLLDYVAREQNILLLLNTVIDEVSLGDDGAIQAVMGFCSQNQVRYLLRSPLFCDASGDGIVGFLAGAVYRVGAEAAREFEERLAPTQTTNDLLGHSLYFYSRDTGRPVEFVAPSFALADITKIPRFRELRVTDSGCRLWWLEFGGALDTVFDTEEIKWELWRIAYGVWNYIKNSGDFPEAATLTLEWVGTIPGKRESRRFEGDFILTQRDIIEQRTHCDAVSYGGWAIDLHPADGIYSSEPGCTQWHSKGIYQIPYRTMYSRNVPNLFLTGRLISASHIAFGSTRVMATCAHNGQAVGVAAALCTAGCWRPRDLLQPFRMHQLQQQLLRAGQFIPGIRSADPNDKARNATVTGSSTFVLAELKPSGENIDLDRCVALLLPLSAGPVPTFTFLATTTADATLTAEFWISDRDGNTTPELLLSSLEAILTPGVKKPVTLDFSISLERPAHVFVTLLDTPGVQMALSTEGVTGILTVTQKLNKAVAKSSVQTPPPNSGVDTFSFWLPDRRPFARNLAVQITPAQELALPKNVINGIARPWCGVNAWMPAADDSNPILRLEWPSTQRIARIELTFDTDFDHPMESVLMGHPERVMPACIRDFRVCVGAGRVLAEVRDNHQTRWHLELDEPIDTDEISIEVKAQGAPVPAIFEVRCY